MGDFQSVDNHISAVILDLDGTLLSTENLTKEILKEFLAGYGKVPDKDKESKKLGMAQKDYAIATVNDYNLPLTPHQFIQEIMPFYQDKWLLAKALPGANRLIRHLHKNGVPFALASNSKKKNVDAKVSLQEGWKEYFSIVLGSDLVTSGKPAPDLFLEAAKQMGVEAAHCLVIEDSVIGVKAGKAARMKVVAVPSFRSEIGEYSIADSVLHSLLELKPEQWGLPPFEDWVGNALPVEPVSFRGLYKNGLLYDFADDWPSTLTDQVFGLHFGWAKPEGNKFLKIVLGIGWELDCCSSKRKMQACIIDSSDEQQIQHCKMEVVIAGYIRGSHYEGKSDKIEILEEDKSIVSAALNLPEFSLGAFKSLFSDECKLDGK